VEATGQHPVGGTDLLVGCRRRHPEGPIVVVAVAGHPSTLWAGPDPLSEPRVSEPRGQRSPPV